MGMLKPFKVLIYDYSGLLLEGIAEQRLAQHVEQNSQRLNIRPEDYLDRLTASEAELDALVGQLTVNETYFFRELEQITLCVQHILPRLLAQITHRPIRILSAGCSSGEEPYSIAMAIREAWGEQGLQRVQIEAGDIDLGVLNKAKQGLYSAFSFRGVEPRLRERYFTKTPVGYQLSDSIRQAVTFFVLNLKAEHYPSERGSYDIIFFRNVSIYFDVLTRQAIQHKFKGIMHPDAVLLLGSSEILGNDFNIFSLIEEQGHYYFTQGQRWQTDTAKQHPSAATTVTPVPTATTPNSAASDAATVVESAPAAPITEPCAPPPPVPAAPLPTLEQIKDLLAEESYDEAQTLLSTLQRKGQTCATLQLMQAWIALNNRVFTEADALLQQRLQESPWDIDTLLAQGLSHKWQCDLNTALQSFKSAAYTHPDSWLAHFFLGDSLRQLGDLQAAQRPLQITRRILSNDIRAETLCQWLPLAPPAQDILFLTERYLLSIKQAQDSSR